MTYLLMTVLLNVLISALFKIFPKYNIDSFQAIVVNYFVCVITGSLFVGYFPINAASLREPWLPFAVGMGLAFISLFNLISYCTKIDGITTTTIANKLSLVIPVIFSLLLYKEHVSILKVAGIVTAFPAVYFTTRVKEKNRRRAKPAAACAAVCRQRAAGYDDKICRTPLPRSTW